MSSSEASEADTKEDEEVETDQLDLHTMPAPKSVTRHPAAYCGLDKPAGEMLNPRLVRCGRGGTAGSRGAAHFGRVNPNPACGSMSIYWPLKG